MSQLRLFCYWQRIYEEAYLCWATDEKEAYPLIVEAVKEEHKTSDRPIEQDEIYEIDIPTEPKVVVVSW